MNKSVARFFFVCSLALIFIFRFRFGTSKFCGVDEIQVYLIGLKYYCSGAYPYWGADVVNTGGQIPGGLQGLLTGGPLFLWANPESPYWLLNLLSFAVLVLLAWYLHKRVWTNNMAYRF